MSNDVVVSVIMGVYNQKNEKILKAAIDSVLNQTEEKIELIICDDGSNADNAAKLEKIASMDERVVLITNKTNRGLSYSLNKCIDLAKGRFVARMDDDDISCATRFEKQIDFLEKNAEFSFVGCNAYLIDDNNKIWGERNVKKYPQKKDFLWGSQFIHPSVVFRTDVLKKNKYNCEGWCERTEDYNLWMRLYAKGFKGANLDDKLLYYREDIKGMKKRKFKYRLNEMKVRYRGYKDLGLFPEGMLFAIKPIFVGFIPHAVIKKIHGVR